MDLRTFYRVMSNLFNNEKGLQYKWTRADGYWKMTKGFINGPTKSVRGVDLLEALQYERWVQEMKKQKKAPGTNKKNKKPYTKYLGDLK